MAIWQRRHDAAALNALQGRTLPDLLGIRITEVGEDFLRAEMAVDERHLQPFGLLHGGASVVLAETVGSLAGWLAVPEGKVVVGVEVNANHLAAVRAGEVVTAQCRPLQLGRSLQVWQIEIRRGDGRLACVSRLTTMVREAPGGDRREAPGGDRRDGAGGDGRDPRG